MVIHHVETQDGWTALHIAANAGSEDLCTLLLGCGAPVNATTPQGESCLHMAVGQRQAGVVNQLLSCQNVQVNPICEVCSVRACNAVSSHMMLFHQRSMWPLETIARGIYSKRTRSYR